MKNIIKSILKNQGFSLGVLAKEADIGRWKLYEAMQGNEKYLSEDEIKKLKMIVKEGSYKIRQIDFRLIKIINEDRYLDVLKILPKKTKYEFLLYAKNIEENKLRIWYQPPTRGRVEFTFPRYIKLNEFFITGLGLSIGDGLNRPSKRNSHYNFSNTNVNLIKIIYDWLTVCLGIEKRAIRVIVIFPPKLKKSIGTFIENIKDKLKLREDSSLNVYVKERHRQPIICLQVGNTIFQCFYLNLFNKLKFKILNDSKLRLSFLRGLFAAEGHVKHSVYGTIESISFSFDPKNEIKLAKFVQKCLIKEGISSKIDDKGSLYFCDYNRMLHFYSLGLISLNNKKEEKFNRLCRNAKIYLHFKKDLLNNLRRFSQKFVGKSFDCSQSNICMLLKNKRINIKYVKDFARLINMSEKKMLNHLDYIQVGNNRIVKRSSIDEMIKIRGLFKGFTFL